MTQWGIDTLFNPAKRHMDEEKRRLQATRQQLGDTSGGKRIDLESGKVRIGKKGDGEPDTDGELDSAGAAETSAAETAVEPSAESATDDAPAKPAKKPKARSGPADAEKKLTPAQIRAAERRRRTAH